MNMLDFFQFTRKILACLGAVLYLRPREGGGGVGVIVSKSLKMGGVTFFKAAAEVGGGVEKYLSLTG